MNNLLTAYLTLADTLMANWKCKAGKRFKGSYAKIDSPPGIYPLPVQLF